MKKTNLLKLNRKKDFSKGFTLIELLVVIAIIALLSSIVMASLATARQKAQDSALLQGIKQLQVAMEIYKSDNGFYPVQNSQCDIPGACTNYLSSINTTLLPLIVPKYLPSLGFLIDLLNPTISFDGFNSLYTIAYVFNFEQYWSHYGKEYDFVTCGEQVYSDDSYMLFFYKYDKNGRKINLPLDDWGENSLYYCVVP